VRDSRNSSKFMALTVGPRSRLTGDVVFPMIRSATSAHRLTDFYCNYAFVVWHNTLASLKSSSRHLRLLAHALRRLPRILRWVVTQLLWKCRLLSLLKLHSPDCECRNDCETPGDEMRKRLEELNWQTPPRLLENRNQGEVVEVFDSKPGEVVASPPISLKPEQRKTA